MRSKQHYNSKVKTKEPKSYSEIPIMAEDKIKVKVYFELKLIPKPVGLSVQCFNVIGLGCCNVWQVDKPTSRQVDKSTSWKADSQVTQKAHVQVLVLLTHHLSWTDVNRPKEAIWAKFVAVKSHGVKTNRGDKLWDKKQEFQKHGFLFFGSTDLSLAAVKRICIRKI